MKIIGMQQIYLSIIVSICLAFVMTGCKKKGSVDAIPSDANGRIEGLAANLPATSEGALFVGDIGEMSKALTVIQTNLSTAVPQLEATRKQAQAELGFDPLDENAWKQAGVPANSGFAVATTNAHAVLLVYVQDRQKFDAELTKQGQKALGTQAAPTSAKAGTFQVKTLKGEGEGKEIVWLHKGKLALITGPALSPEGKTDAAATPAKVLEGLASQKIEQSMLKTPEFGKFQKAMGKGNALVAFANAKAIAKNPLYTKSKGGQDPQQKALSDWFEKNSEALGLAVKADAKELSVTAYLGATDAVNKSVQAWGKPLADGPWDSFATDSTLLGLRASVAPEKLWKYYTTEAPKEQQEEFKKAIARANEQSGLDVEKDIINALTGNVGVFFYGIDLGGAMQGVNNPIAMAKALNLAAAVQFKDKAALDKIMAVIKEKAGPALPGRAMKVGDKEIQEIMVYEGAGGAAKLIIHNNMLVIGTGALPEADAYQYIMGKLEGKKALSAAGGDLGKQFAQKTPFNGLYLNVDKVTAVLGLLLANNPAMDVLKRLSEASLVFDGNDLGMFVNLRLMLKPTDGAAK